jgi:hypothetical protein
VQDYGDIGTVQSEVVRRGYAGLVVEPLTLAQLRCGCGNADSFDVGVATLTDSGCIAIGNAIGNAPSIGMVQKLGLTQVAMPVFIAVHPRTMKPPIQVTDSIAARTHSRASAAQVAVDDCRPMIAVVRFNAVFSITGTGKLNLKMQATLSLDVDGSFPPPRTTSSSTTPATSVIGRRGGPARTPRI